MKRWRYLRSSMWFWFGVIWGGGGSVFVIVGIAMFLDARAFAIDGVRASATIVEKGHGSDSDGDSRYWLRYIYRDDAGGEQVDVTDVGWESWSRYDDGDVIEVRYLQRSPSRSRVDDGVSGTAWWMMPALFGGIGGAFATIGWIVAARTFVGVSRRLRLLERGIVHEGVVTGVYVNHQVRINRRNPLYLGYAFVDDAGAAREGRSPDLPLRLEARWQPGDPIAVVQDRDHPEQHEADIFDLRAGA